MVIIIIIIHGVAPKTSASVQAIAVGGAPLLVELDACRDLRISQTKMSGLGVLRLEFRV